MIDKAVLLGLIFGTTTALLGAIKDTRYEDFDIYKFIRSPVITAVWAYILSRIYNNVDAIMLGLAAVALERITVEVYKAIRTFLGTYKPGKFDYPVHEYTTQDVVNLGIATLIIYFGFVKILQKVI